MLVEWGMEIADKEGLPCWLQSTPQAHGLYSKCGFKDVGVMDIDMCKYGGEGFYTYMCMLWSARRKQNLGEGILRALFSSGCLFEPAPADM